jgi:hypothetical protein
MAVLFAGVLGRLINFNPNFTSFVLFGAATNGQAGEPIEYIVLFWFLLIRHCSNAINAASPLANAQLVGNPRGSS